MMNSISNLLDNPFSARSIQEKIEIKRLGRPTPNLENFTQIVKTGKREFKRKFKIDIYDKCSWLCGCQTRNALFCFQCVLFNGEDTWSKIGFKDLNHLVLRTKKHEASQAHISNSLKLALLGKNNIAEQLDSAYRKNIALHNELVKQNCYVLGIIINCIRFCGVFELALRGHDESVTSKNPGVFKGLINFSSELDAAMKNHLETATVFKGTSKTIQNELLQVMLDVCHEKIANEIKEAKYLAVIADETSDVSNQFQLAIVYRYISNNKPVERFWLFINPPTHDADGLSDCIINELKVHKLEENPQKLIAQTYDGASVMAGVSNGVQAKVRALFPEAQYIHCYAHQLNLVMARAASINRNVRIFFANLQGLCTFFSTSPQRTSILDQTVQSRLPRSAPTRWNFQSRSVETVYAHRKDLIECMETILNSDEIKNDSTISQASGHLNILKSASFIFWLSFFNEIFPYVDILFGQFQKVSTDPTVAHNCLKSFEDNIGKVRNKMMESVTTENDMEEQQKTPKRSKLDRSEWRRESIEVCDVILSHIKERFRFTGHLIATALFASQSFPDYERKFPEKILKSVCSEFKCLNEKKLGMELKTLYSANEFRQITGAIPLHNFIKECNLDEAFSEILKLLEIIITIPMSSAEAERCFSTLKRIKTFLRNSMSEERLSALAMLSIEKDLIMDIPDFNTRVIEKFAGLKERRIDFLFK